MKNNIIADNGLPVLASCAKDVGPYHFSGTHILYINHTVSDAVLTALAFREAGADMSIVGIPYGSLDSPEREWALQTYRDIGATYIPEIPQSTKFKECMYSTVDQAIQSLACVDKNIMIVEDGGYAFPLMHDNRSFHSILDRTLGAVEHTSRGLWNYQYCEQDDTPKTPRFLVKPAITIATSKLKSCHEPIFVAQGVFHELVAVLTKRHEFLPFKKVIVLGHGKIGKPIATLLENIGARVQVVDTKLADETVKSAVNQELFSTSDYFMGASGTPVFSSDQVLKFLQYDTTTNHKMFVSASSKNVEFYNLLIVLEQLYRDDKLVKQLFGSDAKVDKEIVEEFRTTYTIVVAGNNRKYTIIGEGYPIIFFPKHTNGAPNRPFDPVMSQLFMAAATLQKVHGSLDNRVYTLDEIQNEGIVRNSWENYIEDREILVRWCRFNNLDPEWYLSEIKYA